MAKDESKLRIPSGSLVIRLVIEQLDDLLKDAAGAEGAVLEATTKLAPIVLSDAQAILGGKKGGLSYRDGILIQLGYGLISENTFDHTLRAEGARGVAQALGKANAQRHIPKINDAYENIGKNTKNLVRGNVLEFDRLLTWMNTASLEDRTFLFRYALAEVALTARPVLRMPTLRPVELTFARISVFFEELFEVPSGGAHEQFAVAAVLGAMLDQFSSGGLQGLQVKTKNINASDASTGTAADVQIVRGNLIEAVFEVSANDWRHKIDQAVDAAKRAGLSTAHIIAAGTDTADLKAMLSGSTVDISVAEIRSFIRIVCSILRPPAREDALRRLYDLLDRLQPDVALTNGYVTLLRRHAFAAD
ncbi:hypothetical protein [Aquabacter spiritensis]|uniref:Restriction endonuclease n=1 Tax=Aquabacter spiritensis TaxID=933073 RepID=A0A4R3LY02_9HYPH|nr:hypothetical protein [Aquabacter spiritensis]TCT03537.1 hypothetical protein EDC64_10987 [Aquabacter spiritensis]